MSTHDRDLPSPPVLLNWHATWMGKQHAFDGHFHSLCGRIRWTAKLEIDREAPFCRDCVHLAKVAVGRVLDYIVDAEAEAGYAEQDLRNRMQEQAMSEGELVAGYGGLPRDD